MTLSTQLVAGLASGLDWRTMIDELIAVEHRQVDIKENRKSEYEAQLAEWQSFNTKLLSLKTAAEALNHAKDFYLYTSSMSSSSATVKGSDLLSISTTTSAAPGSYSIQVDELAQAHKLASKAFSTYNAALGLSGEFVVNGQAVSVATTDDLATIRDAINDLNTGTTPTGVTATILSVATGDYRLVLTSDAEGKAGIDLKDASSDTSNLVQGLGFTYSSSGTNKTIKNVTGTSEQRSDYFSARTSAVGSLLGITSGQSSTTITIGDKSNISINLASDSLDAIKTAIDTAAPTGVTTSVVETTVDSETKYYLKIEGTTTFGDQNNILETLGILKSDFETVSTNVLTAGQANTTDGSTAITASSTWAQVYGASVAVSDTIAISGTDHDGNIVSGSLTIDNTSHTVQELLTAIQNTFGGNVTASIVDGRIRVTDNTTGDSQLSVTLTENNQGGGALDFGTLAATTIAVGNKRNTTDGSTAITASSTWAQVYGASVTASDTITISGTDHDGNTVSGTLTIDDTSHTVQELIDAIHTTFSNTVTATINSDGKIQIVDDKSGTSYLNVSLTENNEGGGSLDFGIVEVSRGGTDRELVAGSDATLRVDGIQVTSSDNTVENVIAGVTLNLKKADTNTTITLDIDRDIEGIMEKMSTFVDAYNECSSYIQEQQQSYDEETGDGGVLFGDATLSSVKSDLSTTLLETVWGVSTLYSSLGLVGINVDDEGQLSIDTDTLQGYLETNFNDIRKLFAITGTGSAGTLSYETHSLDTEPGEYTVHITNAATRSTETSDRAVSGTLGYNETLTITEGDKTARISLTSSMTLAQIKAAVNTEFETEYTETLVGSQALTTSSSPITSATTWQSIDGTTLQNGDTISFSGTTRGGGTVSGTHTISDVTSDTLQGLLSEIQDDFSNNVTASIDTSGRIVLADKYSGASQLALSITEPTGRGLDFGDVDVTVGASDGSQEGRYAMSITATTSGNQLVLTHDNYGDDYSFTISEDTDTGLWTGSQTTPVSVANGEDVAGTIGGETATGAGQKLTGSAGDIEDLVVSYTGTAENQDIGTVKLTLGVAELFNRMLYYVTDQFDGYVPFKQDSLEDSIDRYADEIEEMESRLDRRMQRMITQFVAMEIALSKLQSQSQWLAGQINGMFS